MRMSGSEYERPPRVLVVEDDDAIAQVLQRSLRMEGYDVRVAADGISALDQAHAFLPDLVILDLGLPKMDGIEVARTLRRTDDVPILVLTARDAGGWASTTTVEEIYGHVDIHDPALDTALRRVWGETT